MNSDTASAVPGMQHWSKDAEIEPGLRRAPNTDGTAMRWPNLKQRIEERFAPEAQTRVEIFLTHYRCADDDVGELWMTLDGGKIYGAAFYSSHAALAAMNCEHLEGPEAADLDDYLADGSIASGEELQDALTQSLNQSVEEMIKSPHPLIRALAILDARFVKRRLSTFKLDKEHQALLRLAALRRRVPAESSIHS
jgi:hypothetical protein